MSKESKPHILIVEDDDVQLFNLQAIFSKTYNPIGVTSGSDCLRLFNDDMSFSGVVMDFTLPDYDGFELIEQIRLLNECILIVLYTAHNSYTITDFEERLSKYPVVHYIQKPATISELCTHTNIFFSEKKLA